MSDTAGGALVSGVRFLQDDFVTKRKNDKDKSKVPIWRTRYNNPFIFLLQEHTEKMEVSDLEFLHFEQDEMPFSIRTLASASYSGGAPVNGNEHIFYVNNSDMGVIKINTILRNSYVNASVDSTTSTVTYTKATSANFKSVVSTPAIGKVTGLGIPSEDYAGYTKVTLQLIHSMIGYAASGLTGIFWISTDPVFRMSKTNHENGEAGEAISKNSEGVTNFTQKFEHEFEISDYTAIVEQFGQDDPYKQVKQGAVNDFTRQIEHSFIWGLGGKQTVNGALETYTYGLNQIIPSANRKQITSYSIAGVNDKVESICVAGAKNRERWWMCGSGFLKKFNSIPESHLTVSPLSGELGLGTTVMVFYDNFGFTHHLVQHREMSQDAVFTDGAFVINFKYLKLAYQKGRDIQIWKGADGTGLQGKGAPKGSLKHQLMCNYGLASSFREAQGYIYF